MRIESSLAEKKREKDDGVITGRLVRGTGLWQTVKGREEGGGNFCSLWESFFFFFFNLWHDLKVKLLVDRKTPGILRRNGQGAGFQADRSQHRFQGWV